MVPDKVDFQYVDSPAALAKLVDAALTTENIGLDSEADSLHHYQEKVCLLQISFAKQNFIIDPLADIDISPLLLCLTDKELIIHDAGYDLRMLQQHHAFGLQGSLFDTMLGAQLLGFEHLGLAAVVERVFDIRLPKGGQKADWSRRPLSPGLLEYASNDTSFLPGLADWMRTELENRGRIEWHRESCANLVKKVAAGDHERPTPGWRRIKSVGTLSRREQAFARELWQWRDKEARRRDRPPFKIIGDKVLTEIAVWSAGRDDIAFDQLPRLPRNIRGERIAALRQTLKRSAAMPKANWPQRKKLPRREKLPPDHTALVAALREEGRRLATSLGLDPAVIASRSKLEAIVRARPTNLDGIIASGPLLRWQATLLEPGLKRILVN